MLNGRDTVTKGILLDNLEFLDLLKKGEIKLDTKETLKRMNEVIEALLKIRKGHPRYEEKIIDDALMRAYEIRINAYFTLGKRNHIIEARNDLLKILELRPTSKSTKQCIKDCDEMLQHPPSLTNKNEESNVKRPKAVRAASVTNASSKRESASKVHKPKKSPELKRQTSLPDLRTIFARAEKPKNNYQQIGNKDRFYQHEGHANKSSLQTSPSSAFTHVTQPGGKTGSGGSK